MKNELMFKLADTMNMHLYEVDGKVRGFEAKHADVGGAWNLSHHVTLIVDEQGDNLVTAFVRIMKHLWSYVVVTEAGIWAIMFDGDSAKIRVGSEHEFGLGSASASLKKIRGSATQAFSMENGIWIQVDAKVLMGST